MSGPRSGRVALLLGVVLLVALWLASLRPIEPPSRQPTESTAARASRASQRAPSRAIHPTASIDPPAVDPGPAAAALGEAPRTARLRVRVVDTDGEAVPDARIQSADCAIAGVADESGRAVLDAPAGTCHMRAARRDGVLFTRSAWSAYQVPANGSIDVLLEVDARPAGGVGVMVAAVGGGMQITGVHPNTPAADAGLAPGPVIVEVDGEPVGELTVEAFLNRITGPAGTEVDVTLRHGDDTGAPTETVLLVRAAYQVAAAP